jgi:hypothetical protein
MIERPNGCVTEHRFLLNQRVLENDPIDFEDETR